MADYEGEDDVLIETEPEDPDFVEEHGEPITCVIQKVLCSQKVLDTTQRHQFYSRCSVKDKVSNLIIDNESCENFVSKALVDYLRLETKPHPHMVQSLGLDRQLGRHRDRLVSATRIGLRRYAQNAT